MNCLIDMAGQQDLVNCAAQAPMRAIPTWIAGRKHTLYRCSVVSVALALTVCVSSGFMQPGWAAAADVPTGTIELSGGSIAAGIGYTWGHGTLIFDGKKYPLTLNGLSLLHVGANYYDASGTVYNLTKVSDINGTYTAVPPRGLGGTVGGGAPVSTIKNPQGVIIQMTATHKGLAFNVGPNGVTLSLGERASRRR
jgi:hypothetical protein